jgi:hypothetical protein
MPFGEPQAANRITYTVGILLKMEYVGDLVSVDMEIVRTGDSASIPEEEMDQQIVAMADALAALEFVQSTSATRRSDGETSFYNPAP